jgi:hypothetical protein
VVEHRVVGVHVEKPAEQQVVVKLLTEHPVAADRIATATLSGPIVPVDPPSSGFSTSCQTSVDEMRHFEEIRIELHIVP